jgi:hypothetical protein
MMKKNCTMRQALEDPDLLGTILAGDTWKPWRIILIAAMGEPLNFWERRTFAKFTGGRKPPGKMVTELVAVAGRRGGKSRAASALACYLAALCDHTAVQAIGETLRVLFLAKDQKQAGVCFDYVSGIFDAVPLFRDMVANRTQDTITLNTGIALEVKAASASGLRGFTCVAVLADEAAHWHTDTSSANADSLILDAVRPSLATTGGPLLILSSPFARKGEVFDLYDRHYGAKGDPGVLIVHGASRDFNASLPKAVVDRALQRNPIAARAEYLAEFRSDLEGYVSLDTLRSCTGQFAERQPVAGIKYTGGIDFSGGSGEDSLALAFCHVEGDADDGQIVVDLVREWRPPFSPSEVIAEVAQLCEQYRVKTLIGDGYAKGFTSDGLWKHNIGYRKSDKTTSVAFAEMLPLLNSHEVELPRHQTTLTQIGALERKPSSRGKEWIGHPPAGHDDCAAAVAMAVAHCAFTPVRSWSDFGAYGAVRSRLHLELRDGLLALRHIPTAGRRAAASIRRARD